MIFPDVVIALLTRHSGSVRVDPVWIVAFVRFEIRTTLERGRGRRRRSHEGEIILNASKRVYYPNQNGISNLCLHSLIVVRVRFEIRTTLERRKRTSHVGEIILNTSKLVNYPNQNGIRLTVSTKTVDPV